MEDLKEEFEKQINATWRVAKKQIMIQGKFPSSQYILDTVPYGSLVIDDSSKPFLASILMVDKQFSVQIKNSILADQDLPKHMYGIELYFFRVKPLGDHSYYVVKMDDTEYLAKSEEEAVTEIVSRFDSEMKTYLETE